MTTRPDRVGSTDSDQIASDDVEALLPWYAAGTLASGEAARVEAALDRDPALADHLARIHEERDASIRSAEALGLPSPRAAAKLFAALEAEPGRARTLNPVAGLMRGAGAWLASLSPGTLGFAAGLAMLALVVQGGFITGGLLRGGATYSTASGDAAAAPGAYALVAFQPEASAAQIGSLLQGLSGRIVDGPYAGGLFKIRIGAADMPQAERNAALARLKEATGVVRMAAPAQ